MLKSLVFLALGSCVSTVQACAHHDDGEVAPPHVREELLKKWDQEVPTPPPPTYIYAYIVDRRLIRQWSFSGINTFAHLKPVKCLIEPDERYDIAVVGAPFDTAVSYRPGASCSTYVLLYRYRALQKNGKLMNRRSIRPASHPRS